MKWVEVQNTSIVRDGMRNVYEILGGKQKKRLLWETCVFFIVDEKQKSSSLLLFLGCWPKFLVPIGISEVETESEVWRKDIAMWEGSQ